MEHKISFRNLVISQMVFSKVFSARMYKIHSLSASLQSNERSYSAYFNIARGSPMILQEFFSKVSYMVTDSKNKPINAFSNNGR